MSKIIYKFAKHTHVSVAYIVVVKTDWNIYECNEDQTLLKKNSPLMAFVESFPLSSTHIGQFSQQSLILSVPLLLQMLCPSTVSLQSTATLCVLPTSLF